MKYIITENQMRGVGFKYLDYLFKDMYEVKSKNHPNSRFWKTNGEVILELKISGDLLVIYSIWSNISTMLSLEYDEAQQLIKDWMEQRLKLGGITPLVERHSFLYWMEQHLKL